MMVACDMLKRLFTTDFAPVVLARSLGLNATNALGPVKVCVRARALYAISGRILNGGLRALLG